MTKNNGYFAVKPATNVGKSLSHISPCLNSVGRLYCLPGKTYTANYFWDYDFHYVFQGTGKVDVDGVTHLKKPGDIFLYSPDTSIIETASLENPQCCIMAHFDTQFVHRTGKGRAVEKPFSTPLPVTLPLRTPGPAPSRISDCFERLTDCTLMANELTRVLYSRSLILEILAYIHERAINHYPGGDIPQRDINRIRHVIEEIKTRLDEPLDLKDMANMVQLSPVYFSTVFKRVIGEPPKAHLLRLKIEKAKDLLRNTTFPVKHIARETGFNSIHYFSRIFSKIVHISPRQFRDEVEFF